ncbi:MAG: 4-aminobutyrate--2-oxoglutarate transaminase [Candidatus Sericytochromatia bacterium]
MSRKFISLKTSIPGPKSLELTEKRKKYVSAGVSMGKVPVFADHAEGALLTDIDGNTFIDFSGGIGCMNSGHSDPNTLKKAEEQAKKLQHTCFQVIMYESYINLAEKLANITPNKVDKKVALFNSGAEAVENAIKIARKHTKRQGIVCFENAFHGRTMLALSLTSKVKPYKDGFAPFSPEIYQAQFPYMYKKPDSMTEDEYIDECIANFHNFLNRTITPNNIAAIIIEPVLGEGGFLVPPKKFLKMLEKLCKDNSIVFIADEIQAGFARTGKMFASEHFDLEPDLITLAKSMSNGFPVSAVVGRADIMDSVQAGGLGGTFAGNPISCAAALGAIETIEKENLCEKAEKIGLIVKERFNNLAKKVPFIGEVRGLGAMIGVEIVKDKKQPDKEKAEKLVYECGQKGLIMLSAGVDGNIIRTLMPLVITEEQLNEALDVIEEVALAL